MGRELLSESKALRGRRDIKHQKDIEIGNPLVMRVIKNERVTYPFHWVPLVPGKGDTPIPCATRGCSSITLPGGEVLHSFPTKNFARFLIFDFNDNRPIIFECGSLIHNDILRYYNSKDWGDLTKYDLRVSAIPQPGPYKKTYKVDPVPPDKSRKITPEIKKMISENLPELLENWEPDRSNETIQALVDSLTVGKETDEDDAAEFGRKFPGIHAGVDFEEKDEKPRPKAKEKAEEILEDDDEEDEKPKDKELKSEIDDIFGDD